jgi:hypothetical protein
MQISRSFLAACGAAYCLALLPLCAADADVESKLREALRQKMNELDAQPAQAVPQPAVAAPSPQKKKAPAPVTKPAPTARPTPPAQWTPATAAQPTVPAQLSSPKAKSEPAVKATATAGKPSAPAPATAAQPAPAPQSPTKPKVIKGQQPLLPIEGPPPSVTADKEQRLQELSAKYKADQITPEEYHQQRAKILAEP